MKATRGSKKSICRASLTTSPVPEHSLLQEKLTEIDNREWDDIYSKFVFTEAEIEKLASNSNLSCEQLYIITSKLHKTAKKFISSTPEIQKFTWIRFLPIFIFYFMQVYTAFLNGLESYENEVGINPKSTESNRQLEKDQKMVENNIRSLPPPDRIVSVWTKPSTWKNMHLFEEQVLGEKGLRVWKKVLSLNFLPLNPTITDSTVIRYLNYRAIEQSLTLEKKPTDTLSSESAKTIFLARFAVIFISKNDTEEMIPFNLVYTRYAEYIKKIDKNLPIVPTKTFTGQLSMAFFFIFNAPIKRVRTDKGIFFQGLKFKCK